MENENQDAGHVDPGSDRFAGLGSGRGAFDSRRGRGGRGGGCSRGGFRGGSRGGVGGEPRYPRGGFSNRVAGGDDAWEEGVTAPASGGDHPNHSALPKPAAEDADGPRGVADAAPCRGAPYRNERFEGRPRYDQNREGAEYQPRFGRGGDRSVPQQRFGRGGYDDERRQPSRYQNVEDAREEHGQATSARFRQGPDDSRPTQQRFSNRGGEGGTYRRGGFSENGGYRGGYRGDYGDRRYGQTGEEQEEEFEEEAKNPRGPPRGLDEMPAEKPQRTTRGPKQRRNCYDDSEVEQLFAQHHKQEGVSLKNYDDIKVDIVPDMDGKPVDDFDELQVEESLMENIRRCGYKKPTPVQRYGIPVVMKGHDLMACAQTGSGKTAAFLVPVIQEILISGVSPARNRISHPLALVLAPTRELALQIYDEVRKLTFKTDIFYDVVYGGTRYPSRFEQDILIACPGRLCDIFDRNFLSLSKIKFLVLDEADRMLEMGFKEELEHLIASRETDMPTPDKRQTLMFSATFPKTIVDLAKRYLRRQYFLLTVGRIGSTTKNITQKVMWVEENQKKEQLLSLIDDMSPEHLVLIFVETKSSAQDLYHTLNSIGIPSDTIHGDRKQFDREAALRSFKSGEMPILVATDVASRGLDIPNVAHVIQYDLPSSMDDYTHRIGRTGRAGNSGSATSFFNKKNSALAHEVWSYLSDHDQDIPDWLANLNNEFERHKFMQATAAPARSAARPGRGGAPARWGDLRGSTAMSAPAAPAAAPATKAGGRSQARPLAANSNMDDGGF